MSREGERQSSLNWLLVYRWFDLPRLAGLALAYALLAKIVLGFFSANGVVSIVWPSSGLALAALLLGGKKYWPGVFIGALVGNVMGGSPAGVSTALAVGSTLEVFACVWLLARIRRFNADLTQPRDFLWLGVTGALGSCVSALIGVATLLLAGLLTKQTIAQNLLQWWQGDTLGIILVAPLILVWRHLPYGWVGRERVVETIACFGLAFLAGQIIFLGWFQDFFGHVVRGYWMFLFVAWAAMRFGRHGALLIISTTAVQVLLGTMQGAGLFSNDFVQSGLVNFWFYTLALTVTGITLAVTIDELKAAEVRIQRLIKLYKALSETNQAIVRIQQQAELFPLVCRCAVEFGGMNLAWIGQLDEASGMIVPVARHGDWQGYLDSLRISAQADVPAGRGPTGTALRENRAIII